jgi:uncharacterized protein (DUF1501 family)
MNTPEIPTVTRRRLLAMLGFGGTAAATGLLGACSIASDAEAVNRSKGTASRRATGGAVSSPRATPTGGARSLVILEIRGGYDGFATLIPYGDGRFRRLRDRIWVDREELLTLDERYALPPGLEPVKDRLAFVEGVGVAKPDLSHFAMLQRWWQGDPDGTGTQHTGFLGRCCDLIAAGEPITGVSVGSGSSQAMVADRAATVSLPQLDMVREIAKPEPNEQRLRAALDRYRRDVADASAAGLDGLDDETGHLMAIARESVGSGLDLLGNFTRLGERPKRYPDNELGTSLAMVRQLISLDVGMRVFHIPWGSLDTHSNQVYAHNEHMATLGTALAAFLDDLDEHGFSERVVLASTSEFGRRAEANGNGTDHGTASTMFLAGAVKPGRHGQAPDFARLDDTGNVKATTSMADYYATLAEGWLGVPAAEAMSAGASVIPGLLRR